jgi:bifunctional DNA-binding transcriptional regulator/antitoxin component of YhaV-PrlF toxin-antitoxin module
LVKKVTTGFELGAVCERIAIQRRHGAASCAQFTRPSESVSNVQLHYSAWDRGGEGDMAVLSVTARGQVTLRRETLAHLGIRPGDKIEVDLLPDGRAQLSAARRGMPARELRGLLAGKTNGAHLSLDEIAEAIGQAAAAAGAGAE